MITQNTADVPAITKGSTELALAALEYVKPLIEKMKVGDEVSPQEVQTAIAVSAGIQFLIQASVKAAVGQNALTGEGPQEVDVPADVVIGVLRGLSGALAAILTVYVEERARPLALAKMASDALVIAGDGETFTSADLATDAIGPTRGNA